MTEGMINASGWILITVAALIFVGLFRLAWLAWCDRAPAEDITDEDYPARHRER